MIDAHRSSDSLADRCAAEADKVLLQSLAVIALFQIPLMLITGPLWHGLSSFPVVPMCRWSAEVPRLLQLVLVIVQLLCFVLMTAGPMILRLCGRTVSRRWVRSAAAAALATGLLLTAASQQRLQPWYWLTMQSLLWFLLTDPQSTVRMLRLMVVTIYVFSAISRISPDLSQTMTGQFAETLLRMAGLKLAAGNSGFVCGCSWMMVAGEFLTGLFLFLRRTRQAGVVMALLLHLILIIVLSPAGMAHQPGVLIWNLMFLVLVPRLFREPRLFPEPRLSRGAIPPESSAVRFRLLTLCCVLFPLSGLFGLADNWLSWQLYSARPEVWKVFVHADSVGELPDAAGPFVGERLPFDDWHPVRIDRWSLAATGAPLYPEDRFQLAIIEWLSRSLSADSGIRVVIDAPERLRFWRRRRAEIRGRSQLRAEQDGWHLNARANELRG